MSLRHGSAVIYHSVNGKISQQSRLSKMFPIRAGFVRNGFSGTEEIPTAFSRGDDLSMK
jgi:hypothetical protein